MTEPIQPILMFPPLAQVAAWAVAPLPRTNEIDELSLLVVAELPRLVQLQSILLIQPGPGRARLHGLVHGVVLRESVLARLRDLRYPPEWTAWVDQARTLARQTNDELARCFHIIDRLKWLADEAPDYWRLLDNARQAAERAWQLATLLSQHFERLPTQLRESRAPACIIQLDDEVRRRLRH